MEIALQNPSLPVSPPNFSATVLVVDDSRAQRRLLSTYLSKWGYDVIEAGSGREALELCRKTTPDLIISDWMMPGMDGLEFCQAYRNLPGDRYGYFVLLTSKSEKGEVAHGLDMGADDFLTKPVHAAELRARLRAGLRVLRMERELTEQNRLVGATLAEMQTLYDALDRDLIEARMLQQSLVPDRVMRFSGADVSMLLQPAGHVGGDLVGVFAVSDTEIGAYSIDVSGHGIASALLTARLAAYFSGNSPMQNIAIGKGDDGVPKMRPPADAAATLNALILDELETEHYLTILLARIDLRSGRVTMVQAGHPHPAVQRADGTVEFPGDGGLPVGLIAGATYDEFTVDLMPGDRLFLGSDGFTECQNPKGEMLDESGLKKLLENNKELSGMTFFQALLRDLTGFAGTLEFSDDVSGLMLEFTGA